MRNISQEFKNLIISAFPKENTIGIIIFGSYGTIRQTNKSDIDIAWIPRNRVSLAEFRIKVQELKEILSVEVDLKVIKNSFSIALRRNAFEGDVIYESEDYREYVNNFYVENSDVLDILDWERGSRTNNKLIWNNLEELNLAFELCLQNLQNFKKCYNKTEFPIFKERYNKEEFKNSLVSFLELTKAMLYYKAIDLKIKSVSFEGYLSTCESCNLLPENSAIILEALRKLRNNNSHASSTLQFKEMYELFIQNEDIFINIRNSCNNKYIDK